MRSQFDHRARPWRDPDDPDHIECLACGEPVCAAGNSWRHSEEPANENRPLPNDSAMFETALETVAAAVRNLPPDAGDEAKVHAAVDILYWRGALRQGAWRRPDQRRRTHAA